MSRRAALAAVIMSLVLLAACARPPAPVPPRPVAPRPAFDLSVLQGALETTGLPVTNSSDVTETVFSGLAQGQPLNVAGRELQIYWFPSSRDATAAISMVRSDGYAFRINRHYIPVQWAGDPHFFGRDRSVVVYVSTSTTPTPTDSKILAVLKQQMGPQFAGTR